MSDLSTRMRSLLEAGDSGSDRWVRYISDVQDRRSDFEAQEYRRDAKTLLSALPEAPESVKQDAQRLIGMLLDISKLIDRSNTLCDSVLEATKAASKKSKD